MRNAYMLPLRLFALGIPLMVTTSGVGSATSKKSAPAPQQARPAAVHSLIDNVGAPRVQEAWQSAFLHMLAQAKDKAASGWGVLTYSGWADSGQFFMIVDGSKKSFYQVPVNYQTKSKDHTSWRLEPALWQHFHLSLKPAQVQAIEAAAQGFRGLKDLNAKVFDGLEIEYVHAHKLGDKVVVDSRMYMHSAGDADSKKHQEIADDFFKKVDGIKK
jgi:hypothetical protein